MNSYLGELYMRKGPQENKISLCLKKQNQSHDKPSTFLLAGRISAPSHTAPAGEPSLAAKPTLLMPVSFHSLLPLPSSLIGSSSSSCSCSICLFWLQRDATPMLFAEGKEGKHLFGASRVRVIFLAAEINRSSSAVSILLHFQVGGVFCPWPEPASPIKSRQRNSLPMYFWV